MDRRRIRISEILAGVIKGKIREYVCSLWKDKRLLISVLLLPIKIPIGYPQQRHILLIWQDCMNDDFLTNKMSMSNDPVDIEIIFEHSIDLHMLDGIRWNIDIDVTENNINRFFRLRLICKV